MKKGLLKILIMSAVITTIGLIMDGDPKAPSMATRFLEFFAMIGTLSLVISIIYFTTTFMRRKALKLKSGSR